jgi:hypothetical protein
MSKALWRRHFAQYHLNFQIAAGSGAENIIYVSGDEVVSDMGVEVFSFGFGRKKFFVFLGRNIQVLVDESGAEFDFEHALLGQIQDRSQYGRFDRRAGQCLHHRR